jgi:hypothetical protein
LLSNLKKTKVIVHKNPNPGVNEGAMNSSHSSALANEEILK